MAPGVGPQHLANPRALFIRDRADLGSRILGAWSEAFPGSKAPESVTNAADAELCLHKHAFHVILYDATRGREGLDSTLTRLSRVSSKAARIAVLPSRGEVRPPRGAHAAFRAEHTSPRTLVRSVEEALRVADLEQREASALRARDITVLASALTHSFNNHLGTVLGHASLLASSLGPRDKAQENLRYLMEAAEQATRETATFQEVLHTAPTRSTSFALGPVFQGLRTTLEATCRARLEIELADEVRTLPLLGSAPTAAHLLEALIRAADEGQSRGGFIRVHAAPVPTPPDASGTIGQRVCLRIEHGGTDGIGAVALTPATASLPDGLRWPVIHTLTTQLRASLSQSESPNHMTWTVMLHIAR